MWTKKSVSFIRLIIPVLMLIFLLTGCSERKSYQKINFNDLEEKPVNSGAEVNNTFRVALAAITSSKESISYYEELLALLGDELNQPIRIVQRNTYGEINALLRSGHIDMAFICTNAYVEGRDQFGLELIAAPVRDGQARYSGYVIVKKDSGITSFAQLRGKKFAFTDPMSTTGYLYPQSLVKELGHNYDTYFSDYIFTYSHDNSARAVWQGIADGASVDAMVFKHLSKNKPFITESLQVIQESVLFASPPVVVRPGLDTKVKEQLREFLSKLASDSEGKLILQNMGLEGYVGVEDADYNSVRDLRRKALQ